MQLCEHVRIQICSPCTLVCAATLAEMKPEAFWREIGDASYQPFDCPETLKKPLDLFHSNMNGVLLAPATRY